MRRAAKRDLAEPPIIQALEQCGFEVWPLNQPCDLICRRSDWPAGLFQALEVKTGKRGVRASQTGQQKFLEATKTPIVRTPIEALRAVGIKLPQETI